MKCNLRIGRFEFGLWSRVQPLVLCPDSGLGSRLWSRSSLRSVGKGKPHAGCPNWIKQLTMKTVLPIVFKTMVVVIFIKIVLKMNFK